MANVKGLELLVMVGVTAAAPLTWGELEGQTSGTMDGSVAFADATDKTTGAWDKSVATTRSMNISVAGNVMDPGSRPNFDLLKTAWLNGTTHHCQIILDEEGAGFAADFFVQFSITGETRDVEKYTIELRPGGLVTAVVPV